MKDIVTQATYHKTISAQLNSNKDSDIIKFMIDEAEITNDSNSEIIKRALKFYMKNRNNESIIKKEQHIDDSYLKQLVQSEIQIALKQQGVNIMQAEEPFKEEVKITKSKEIKVEEVKNEEKNNDDFEKTSFDDDDIQSNFSASYVKSMVGI